MKKILITGGSGTVGTAFITEYRNEFEFINFSRNEENIADIKRQFPEIKNVIGDIRNIDHLVNTFETISPDIVIHAAAIKHIDMAEDNPTETVEINIVGSLNVIKAAVRAKIPLTVGISTDKACDPDSIYGYTKSIMERLFLDYSNDKTKFICTRFANVAGSNGSVIPFWKSLASKNKPLRLTDAKMNRLMFSKKESAILIYKAIQKANDSNTPFVMSKIMKSVNILDLAHIISDNIKIVGKRPGEKINEILIGEKELERTSVGEGEYMGYVFIFSEKTKDSSCILEKEHSSLTADRMSFDEIKEIIK